MSDDYGAGAVFNFDAAQLIILFGLKDEILLLFGDFAKAQEDLYRKLRDFWREIDALADKEERTQLKNSMDKLTELKNTFLGEKNNENLNRYFLVSEAFYLDLCRTLKAHKIYYREGLDPRRAGLRR